MPTYILRVSAADQPGMLARVSGYVFDAGFNIEDAAQFHDHVTGRFYMRLSFETMHGGLSVDDFKGGFQRIADDFDMAWSMHNEAEKVKALIMVSKTDHCLEDLIYRVKTKQLPIEITAVVSNHETCRQQVEARGLRFVYLPMTEDSKAEQEKALSYLIAETNSDVVVMARYMQILTDAFCEEYAGRVINIHHSFLPGFKGAKPYHQAWERGVKIIGATAHFATADLDEGPIIEQETVRITHHMTPQKLQMMGKDIESRVLARALLYYSEHRIFVFGGRTIIL